MRKILVVLMLAVFTTVNAGCGFFAEEEKTEAAQPKKEPKVAKITFGDYPSDDEVDGLLNKRSHFGKDEDIALAFDLPGDQKFDTKYIKVKVLKQPGNKLIDEFTEDVTLPGKAINMSSLPSTPISTDSSIRATIPSKFSVGTKSWQRGNWKSWINKPHHQAPHSGAYFLIYSGDSINRVKMASY